MKTVVRERTNVEKYEVYVAADGTEFTNCDECEKYEESAKGVLMAKIRPLVVKEASQEDILGWGSCEDTVLVLKLKTQADADAVMQMMCLENKHLMENSYRDHADRVQGYVNSALATNDCLLVNLGYECDGFWIEGTCTSLVEKLQKFFTIEEKNEKDA